MIRSPQTVEVRSEGYRDANGRWVEGGTVPTIIIASVQPATSSDYDEMQARPEGRRIERMVRVYTDQKLNVAGEDAHNGDALLWEGSRYTFAAVSPWRTTMLKHYRYLAVKDVEQ